MPVDFRHCRSVRAIDRKGKEHFVSGTGKLPRRDFLKQAAGVIGASTRTSEWSATTTRPSQRLGFSLLSKGKRAWVQIMRSGLSRLESAKFTGQYPMASIEFEDRTLLSITFNMREQNLP
jgi:hypothetical protein